MTTPRKYNFSAGPCTLPLPALEQAQQEFVDYHGAGMSLIEMSHRGEHFMQVAADTATLAMQMFHAPDDFQVLFLQGGATLQFSMLPMNLLHTGQKGAYVNSGAWAKGALNDGAFHGSVYAAWDGTDCQYTRMPTAAEIKLQDNTRYLHITSNETIGGVRFAEFPEVAVPLIGDMSSDYMSRAIPWQQFDLVYGGAQKNLGPAGLTVLFIRKSILETTNQKLGNYLRYDIHAAKDSMFNTPPVFAVYMLGKVLQWMKAEGGLATMEKNAAQKSALLYATIDQSENFYACPIETAYRSHMNVVFRLPNAELEKQFLTECARADLLNLKGHRSVGGIRASIYNAMPLAGVQALCDLMSDFQNKNA